MFFVVWGVVLVGIVLLFRDVLLPFFLAVVVAYVLDPLVQKLERARFRQRFLPRWAAVLILYVALLGTMSGFAIVSVPRLAAETEALAREAPHFVKRVRDDWLPSLEKRFRAAMAPYSRASSIPADTEKDVHRAAMQPRAIRVRTVSSDHGAEYEITLPQRGLLVQRRGSTYRVSLEASRDRTGSDLSTSISETLRRMTENTQEHAVTVLKTARSIIETVIRGVFMLFIMLMLSAYLLITKDRILAFLRSLVASQRRESFDQLLVRIDQGLSGVVRGQLLICLVNGLLSGIGFYILELRYWPILTLIAGVLSIIPIFGSILSSIPAVLIGLQDGFGTAALVLVWILVIHQIEGNLLNPKIMGDAAKVHPVLVVFALLAGEHLFGIAGALLAVPVLSITQSLFLHYREYALGVPATAAAPQPLP